MSKDPDDVATKILVHYLACLPPRRQALSPDLLDCNITWRRKRDALPPMKAAADFRASIKQQ